MFLFNKSLYQQNLFILVFEQVQSMLPYVVRNKEARETQLSIVAVIDDLGEQKKVSPYIVMIPEMIMLVVEIPIKKSIQSLNMKQNSW